MDCNRCNTNYTQNNYNMRNNMQSKMHSGMHSNMHNRSMENRSNIVTRENNDCNKTNKHDDCNKMKEHVDHMAPGMSYVPWQKWEEIYDMKKGFERGTIFCQLDKPYVGRCAK